MGGTVRRSAVVAGCVLFAAACGDGRALPGSGGAGGIVATGHGGQGGDGGALPCCGCLCRDPTWSCSKETCLADDGTALALVPEAGFFELAGADYASYLGAAGSPRARVWYSFQPAEEDPSQKPLVILFNGVGGPALGVLGFNTGHFTFDPDFTDGADFADNPWRWTDFANLLYVDGPGTGYSYHLPRADGASPPVVFDAYAEAGDYLRIVLRFLARHPQIAAAPIAIVGESGGGIRGTYMAELLLDHAALVSGGPYRDTQLREEILAFRAARRPDLEPEAWTADDVGSVLSHQIYIDPMLTTHQWAYGDALADDPPDGCAPEPDPLDCSETVEEADAVRQHLVRVATDPDLLSQVLRCDVTSIEWMHAAARHGAYARGEYMDRPGADASRLAAVFGELEPGDAYFVFNADDINRTWDLGPAEAGRRENPEHGRVALRAIHDVPTMITNGAYDLLFNAQFIAPSLATYEDVLASATWQEGQPADAARPGQLELVYAPGLPYGGGTRIVPMPRYAAGHSVSHGAPAELRDDVRAFLAGALGDGP